MTQDESLSFFLAAERAVRPPAAALEQGLTRLLADVSTGAAPMAGATGSLQLLGSGVAKWVVVGFTVGLAGAGTAASVSGALETTPPVQAAAAATAVTAPRVSPSVLHEPAALVEAPPESTPAVAVPKLPGARGVENGLPSSSPVAAERFDEELRLITLAKSELDAGRPHLSKRSLAEHARRFPSGVFSTDREALSVLARCAERREPELAWQFERRHPGSAMNARLLRACETATPTQSTNENKRAGERTADREAE